MLIKCEKINSFKTDTGELVSYYSGDPAHVIKSIYTTSMRRDNRKGPIMHVESTQMISIVTGRVRLTIRHKEGLAQFVLDSSNHMRVIIPPNHWYQIDAFEDSIIINTPDKVWNANDKAVLEDGFPELQPLGNYAK